MAFQTFDLGRVLQQGEAIKGMKRHGITDQLQQQYLTQNIKAGETAATNVAADREAKLGKDKATQVFTTMQYALQSPDPSAFVEQNAPELIQELSKNGVNWQQLDQPSRLRMLQGIQAKAGAEIGQGPAPRPVQMETIKNPDGSVFQKDPTTGKLTEVQGRKPRDPTPATPPKQWVSMTAEEIKQAGLPEGTSAQRSPETGEVNILNKREGLSGAEQKQIRDAKVRMPRLNAAVRRAERVGNAVAALADNPMFNGGTVDAYVLGQTPEGKELQAAVASLMPELQALTRVPGIGSQSDLEARLASLALPSLEMNPEINQRTFEELKSFLDDLKAAYASITGEEVKAPTPPKIDGKPRSLDDILNQYAK